MSRLQFCWADDLNVFIFFYLSLEIGLNVSTENVNKVVVIFSFDWIGPSRIISVAKQYIFSDGRNTPLQSSLREASGA